MALAKPSGPVVAVERSNDRKLSKDRSASATWVSQRSCPSTCPFLNSGCYAETHKAGMVTRRLNAAAEALTDEGLTSLDLAKEEAKQIRYLSGMRPLRLHVVGDCATDEAAKVLSIAAEEYKRKDNAPVWTYTHSSTERASWGSISVLKSCSNTAEAEEALTNGFAPAIVVEDFEQKGAYTLPGTDIKGIPCPAQTHKEKSVSCVDCKLCWNADRLHSERKAILFKSHGVRKNLVNQIISL